MKFVDFDLVRIVARTTATASIHKAFPERFTETTNTKQNQNRKNQKD